MEDDGPNFSYAYGGDSSWNPALRPSSPVVNAPKTEDTQKPDAAGMVAEVQDDNEQAFGDNQPEPEVGETFRTDSTEAPDQVAPQALESELSPQPVVEEVLPSRNAPASVEGASDALGWRSAAGTGDEHAEAFQALSSNSTAPEETTNEPSSSTPLYPDSTDRDAIAEALPATEEHTAEEDYEHQGESSFLDDAMQEDVQEPLLEDDEVAIDWDTNEADFGIPTSGTDVLLEQNAAETRPLASFEDQPFEQTSRPVEEPAIDWGTTEDQDFSWDTAAQSEPTPGLRAAFTTNFTEDSTNDALGVSENDAQVSQVTETPKDADMAAWQAAFGDDELLEDETGAGPAFFEDDGEGFLEETASQPAPSSQTTEFTKPIATAFAQSLDNAAASRYSPAPSQGPLQTSNNAYAPQGPQFTDFSQMNQQQRGQKAYTQYPQAAPYTVQHQQVRPAAQSSGNSFADKAKSGYASPYDLPDDISKPRRRQAGPSRLAQATPPAPPPRTSSIGSPTGPDMTRSMSSTSGGYPQGQVRPPSSGSVYQPGPARARKPSLEKSPGAPSPSASSFFEDLPVVSRPRHGTPFGRFTPQTNAQPQFQAQAHPGPPTPAMMPQAQQTPPNPYASQLQQPARVPLFPDAPTATPQQIQQPAPPSNRYSPAPGAAPASTAPPTAPRYSPMPPPQQAPAQAANRYAAEPSGPPRPPSFPFAPRTSSPLAQSHTQSPEATAAALNQKPLPQPPQHANYQPSSYEPDSHSRSIQPQQNGFAAGVPPPGVKPTVTPPPPSHIPQTVSPRKRATYNPSSQLPPVSEQGIIPPPRSQSQSPGSRIRNPKLATTLIDRPASAYDLPSPKRATTEPARKFSLPHRRGYSQDFDFMPPQDERVADDLERWKGCPIFSWGAGGHVVTAFPKHVPFYGARQKAPMIKSSPGEVRLQNVKELLPADAILTTFPGPLKKGKKKEVVAWLKNAVVLLESQQLPPQHLQASQDIGTKRAEEKLLLWRVMLCLVEHDGVLEGTPAVQDAVRQVLQSQGDMSASIPFLQTPLEGPRAPSSASSHPISADPVNPQAVALIREHLTKGDREKAAWMAVDERLWGHAMLISSTLSKDIWKQVIQEFVRKEVKSTGAGNEALAALYEVFASNWEESIDELVPASARAGFQMISTIDSAGPGKDATAGLNKWKETLLMVLSNRTPDDTQALLALGKLLAGYGRIEAAHICYIFARQTIYFGGAEDPQSQLTLLEADPRLSVDFGKDMESILLTEVYEFATSMGASSFAAIPHLQAYKLYHAFALAEAGYRNEAQQYCDTIASLITSKTRSSPYYNVQFVGKLDDLGKRLAQTPSTSSSSWISKPSVDKVSSSLFAKFNNFIAGDDSDAASTGSGHNDQAGPFAIAGDTRTISRTTSAADLYSTFSNGTAVPTGAQGTPPVNIKYAPNSAGANAYQPRSSLDQPRSRYDPYAPQSSRTSLESTRPGESAYSPAASDFNPYTSLQAPGAQGQMQPTHSPPLQRSHAPLSARTSSYQGVPAANGHTASSLAPHGAYTPPQNAYTPSPYQGTPEPESAAPTSAYQPRQPSPLLTSPPLQQPSFSYDPQYPAEEPRSFAPPVQEPEPALIPSVEESLAELSYEHPAAGYEPPSSSYEPPQSYQPYVPEPDSPESPQDAKRSQKPKKGVMDLDDDDDDLAARAAALKKQQKSEADRAADEAFRKAAEADGMSSSLPIPYTSNEHDIDISYSLPPQKPPAQVLLVRRLVQERPQRSSNRPHQGQAWRGKQLRLRHRSQEVGQ